MRISACTRTWGYAALNRPRPARLDRPGPPPLPAASHHRTAGSSCRMSRNAVSTMNGTKLALSKHMCTYHCSGLHRD
jgi:hypothetical protein